MMNLFQHSYAALSTKIAPRDAGLPSFGICFLRKVAEASGLSLQKKDSGGTPLSLSPTRSGEVGPMLKLNLRRAGGFGQRERPHLLADDFGMGERAGFDSHANRCERT